LGMLGEVECGIVTQYLVKIVGKTLNSAHNMVLSDTSIQRRGKIMSPTLQILFAALAFGLSAFFATRLRLTMGEKGGTRYVRDFLNYPS
jgi:hypothetical protein